VRRARRDGDGGDVRFYFESRDGALVLPARSFRLSAMIVYQRSLKIISNVSVREAHRINTRDRVG